MKWILIFRDFQWFIPKKITIIYYYILYIIHIFIQQLKDMNCCFGNDNSQTKKKNNKMYLKKVLWFFSICRNALVILFTSTIAFYFEKIGSSPFILSGLFLLYFIEICIENSYNELFFVINFFSDLKEKYNLDFPIFLYLHFHLILEMKLILFGKWLLT